MKKKNRIYFIVLLAICGSILFIWFHKLNEPKARLYTTQSTVTKFRSKLGYYKKFPGKIDENIFITNYKNTVDRILKLNLEIDCVGERIKSVKDSLIIDLFVIGKKNNGTYISFIKNINGNIFAKEIKTKSPLPDLPGFCDSHYFYLNKSPRYSYDSYSISLIDNSKFEDVKIFFSDSYDNFINVKCKCDSSSISDLLNYIESTFASQQF